MSPISNSKLPALLAILFLALGVAYINLFPPVDDAPVASIVSEVSVEDMTSAARNRNRNPVANAGVDKVIAPNVSVLFNSSASTDVDGRVVKSEWDFGDGSRAVGKLVSHTYRSAGEFRVKLKVTDDRRGTNSDTAIVNVGVQAQNAGFTPAGQVSGSIQAKFVGSNLSTATLPTGVLWSLDNGVLIPAIGAVLQGITTGDHVVTISDLSGYSELYATCSYAAGTRECFIPSDASYTTAGMSCVEGEVAGSNTCSFPINVKGGYTTKFVVKYTVATTPDTFDMYINKQGSGEIMTNFSGFNCDINCTRSGGALRRTQWLDFPLSLQAIPASGYTFAGWSGDVAREYEGLPTCQDAGHCITVLSGPTNITATFVADNVNPGVVDSQEPTTPLWLRWGDVTDTSIVIGWAASTDNVGVTGYKIYKSSGSSEPTYYRTTTDNTHTVTGLTPSTNYNFKVSAVDAAGNESDKVGLSISTQEGRVNDIPVADSVPPSIPLWVRWGDINANSIVIGWPVSTDNVGVTGYKIYRSISPSQPTYITTVTGTSYVNTNLSADTLYSFAVSAVDAAGNESDKVGLTISTGQDLGGGGNNNQPPSNPVSDVNPPSIPLRVGWGNTTSNSIVIGWPASSDDVAVTGYKIYRSVYPNEPVYFTTVTGTSYTNTGLMANTNYNFKVSAMDAAGNESDKAGLVISTNP